jgi:hypothetical protein
MVDMKKQMSPTMYGTTAKEAAEEWAQRLQNEVNEGAASGSTGNWCHIAMPWDRWSVEPLDDGWAVFVQQRLVKE